MNTMTRLGMPASQPVLLTAPLPLEKFAPQSDLCDNALRRTPRCLDSCCFFLQGVVDHIDGELARLTGPRGHPDETCVSWRCAPWDVRS